jgi:hypothetical protein
VYGNTDWIKANSQIKVVMADSRNTSQIKDMQQNLSINKEIIKNLIEVQQKAGHSQ